MAIPYGGLRRLMRLLTLSLAATIFPFSSSSFSRNSFFIYLYNPPSPLAIPVSRPFPLSRVSHTGLDNRPGGG
ncbi:hypothetical protein GGS23DRAFT_523117 [Durotheca rogersii]|uniref:uncharacterized protein n=1 Tax=Durotheca rogersii TaxID=419775 RepID=UPI00221E6DE5|nr:uncharacterized protein GGS23DRAFT_523117 [Durotheca rogersii]KAI5863968.1 hypothetical protein GGS23DRAFT_523117 [Durotheca rogersii]